MARRPVALVTGAGGEMGHTLVHRLADDGVDVVALDVRKVDDDIAAGVTPRSRATFSTAVCSSGS